MVAFRVLLLDGDGHELEAVPDGDWIRFETVTADWSA